MNRSETRHPLATWILVLSAAAALGTAGCSNSNQGQSGAVASLSDLPNKSQSMLKLGDASRDAGDCTAALRFYRLAIGKGNSKAETATARLGSAECELAMGNTAAAEQNYLAVAKLEPNDPAPHFGLGRVYLVEHQPDRAVGYFDLAVKEGAHEAFVWNDKGVAFDQLRRHKEAQQAYREGLADHPADPALRNNLALSLAMTGDFPEAESLLRQLAADPSADARTRENLALVLGLEGDDAGARAVSEADLNGAALDNNTRFYQYARALLTGAPLPSPSAAATEITPPPARIARAAAPVPVPPPVLVVTRPDPASDAIAMAKDPPPPTMPPGQPLAADPGPHEVAGAAPSQPVAATQTIAAVPRSTPVASSDGQ